MFKWKVGFIEDTNGAKKMMKRSLPLDIMKLTDTDLNRQFTVYPLCVGPHAEYSTRELIFKLYDVDSCKILHLTGKNSVQAISELLSELPPVYIFHAELSLTDERFTDLSSLNLLNAVYAIKINGYSAHCECFACSNCMHEFSKKTHSTLFLYNLEKVIEEGLQFYWIE